MNILKKVIRKFLPKPPFNKGYYSKNLNYLADRLYSFKKKEVLYKGIRRGKYGLYDIDTTEWMGWNVYMYGAYADHLLQLFELYIQKDSIVLDIGANQGLTSIPLSRMVGKDGHVYSFEINEIALNKLRSNILLNNISNISVISKAISNKTSKGTLYSPLFGTGSLSGVGANNLSGLSSLAKPKEEYMEGVEFVEHQVEITTIDEFVKQEKIKRIDFIKIDIEGFDGRAIQGGVRSIETFKPIILFEYDPVWLSRARMTLKECLDFMEGYIFFEVVSDLYDVLRPLSEEILKNSEWSGDILCLPKNSNNLKKS